MKSIQGLHSQAAEVRFPERNFNHSRSRKGPAIFLWAACASSSLAFPAAALAQDSPATQPAATIEIPFQFMNDNLVIVKATIGGLRNLNMMVDTGTSPSSISKAVADKLKLPRKAESVETLNGTMRAESVVLPALDFGPIHTGSLRVMVQDLGFIERSLGMTIGGIIGLDVLTTGSFTIDYRRKSIAFGAVPPGLKTVPFAATAPSITVRAKIDGQEVRLLVDSGTEGLVLYRNRKGMAAAPHSDQRVSISTLSGSTRLSWVKTRVSVGAEDLGTRDIAIADVDSNFGDEFDGLMGFAKMGFRRVAFDFENGRFGWD
jgi:predicted aspartyl protease